MTRIPGIKRLFRLDRKQDVDQAVDDELRFHLDMTAQELIAQGWGEADARREAERRFGDLPGVRRDITALDRTRVARRDRAEWWGGLAQDVRYAARGLVRKPGFTLGVMLTLGLGIGANATMFGIVDRLLFRAPRFMTAPARVHRFVFFRTNRDGSEFAGSNTSYKVWQDLRELTRSFDQVALYFEPEPAVGEGVDAKEERVLGISAAYWSMFDVKPAVGRFFNASEDTLPRGTEVAVLGYAYWQRAFGGRPDVVGTHLRIGEGSYTIIGVAPRGFVGTSQHSPAAFVPATAALLDGVHAGDTDPTQTYGWSWPEILLRRKPGVTQQEADADLTHAAQISYGRRRVEQPGMPPIGLTKPRAIAASVLRERGPQASNDVKVALWLVGVAVIVLIIACANVGNLLLARAFGRRREIAVRLALGVGRFRLLTQLLTESLLLALLGGAAGVAVAQWGGGILRGTLLPDVAWTSAIADPRVLLFAGAAALVAGLLAGLAPAWFAGRSDVAASLKAGVREGTYHRSRTRTALLVVQGALTAVLLVGAGLFVRSFQHVRNVPLGYDTEKLLVATLTMRGEVLSDTQAMALRNRLYERARALPGVEHAARMLTVPFWMTWDFNLFVPGVDTSRLNKLDVTLQAGTPDYFLTTGTRLLRGRGIEPGDVAGSPLVMVVSDSMARAIWPGLDPIGKCVKLSADTVPCRTVVGVVENIKHSDFKDDPGLNYYLPTTQFHPQDGGLTIRTIGPAEGQAEAVRRALQPLMPGQSYIEVKELSETVNSGMRQWQLGATMFTVFGFLALLVAAVGLYSVIAYSVAQRTHELGVRVALGAQLGDLVRLVVGEGVRLGLIAAVLGTTAAAWASRFVAPLLFDTSPRDPVILGGVAATLLVIATVASLVPALRAARVSPNVALRDE